MLFLAWSLFHFAIRFGRRHRLNALLSECFSASPLLPPFATAACARRRCHESLRDVRCASPTLGNSSSHYQIICCRPTKPSSPYQQTFHTSNTTLRRVPSAPVLPTKSHSKNVRKIYGDEQREIVVNAGDDEHQTPFRSSDWSFEVPVLYHPTFQSNSVVSNDETNCVYFSARMSSFGPFAPHSPNQMALNCNFLDSFAHAIAHHRAYPFLRLYTAPISSFFDLVFCWSDGMLFEREMNAHVEEIQTVSLCFIIHAQKTRQFCPSKRRLHASLPSRPPSLLELMFLRESEKRQFIRRSNCCGEERSFSRFSTTSLPARESPLLPNYLKRMRRRKCKSGGSEMSANTAEVVAGTYLLGSQRMAWASSRISNTSSVSMLEENGVIQLMSDFSLEKDVSEREAVSPDHFPIHPSLIRSNSSSTIECPPVDVITEQSNPNKSVKGEATKTRNCSSLSMNTLKFPSPGHCQLSRSTSLMPSSAITTLHASSADTIRRRSLSPLTLSLLVNYGGHEHSLVSGGPVPPTAALFAADPHFPGKLPHRRAQSLPRRSFVSVLPGNDENGQRHSGKSAEKYQPTNETLSDPTTANGNRPRQKPPSLLVYCGDDKTLFDGIRTALRRIVPDDTYTISALTTKALLVHPWMDSCACLIVADASRLDNASWNRLQIYFVNSGKILFICENSLLSSLTSSSSQREQSALLRNALGNKAVTATMGKEFGDFLKRSLKALAKNGQINETFYARDSIGGTRFSVVLHKIKEQPLLLYMQNLGQRASALFSDATVEQLLSAGDGALVRDALRRLGLKDINQKATPMGQKGPPPLSCGYLIAARDLLILDIPGMTYDKVLGCTKQPIIFHRYDRQQSLAREDTGDNQSDADKPPPVDALPAFDQLLSVEVRRRRDGLPEEGLTDQRRFNVEQYFSLLTTKMLGRVLLYVPVCGTTMEVADSLSHAFPLFDGILVVADIQLAGRGRMGNEWISPAGCASFTFNINIPCDSNLGRSICFLQHITAVSVASAVHKLLSDEIPDFPIRLKWPNDIYYERSYKLGGLIVQLSQCSSNFCCAVGVGLNVANAKPTVCINDMLPMHSNRQLTVEEVLAQTMNEFEHFVNVFENKGRAEFLKSYYHFWMHSHEVVQIVRGENSGRREKVVIRGLDEHGYLEVRSKETGQILSVMDDGNTFDLFHGLIVPK